MNSLSATDKLNEVAFYNLLCKAPNQVQKTVSDVADESGAMNAIPLDNDTEEENGDLNQAVSVEPNEVTTIPPEVQSMQEQTAESSPHFLDRSSRSNRGGRMQELITNEQTRCNASSKPSKDEVARTKMELIMGAFSKGQKPKKYNLLKLDFSKILEYYTSCMTLQTDEKQWYSSIGLKPKAGTFGVYPTSVDNCNPIRVSLLVWKILQSYKLNGEYQYLNDSCFRDSLIQFLLSRNPTATDSAFDTCEIQTILEESSTHSFFIYVVDRIASPLDCNSGTGQNLYVFSSPMSSSEQNSSNPGRGKSGRIQFNHPGSDVNVIELRVCGTLQADGIPLFESAAKDKSAEVILFAVHSCNPSHQSSRAFMIYLGIVTGFNATKDDSFYARVFKEIQLSTTVLGKYGCYFRKDKQWYHLTWYIQGLMCDYLALTQIAKHGNSSATFPCILCPAEKKLYNPLYGSLLPSTWGQIFDSKTMKVIDSSLNFINPNSLYRMSSIVYQLLIKKKDSLYDQLRKNTQPISQSNTEEYTHLMELFTFLDHSYLLMWSPPVLNSLDSLQRAMSLTASATSGVSYQVSRADQEELIQELTTCKLMPPTPPTGEDENQQAMMLLPKGGVYSLDPMHLFSNTFKRFCVCLNNQLPTYGDSSYYKSITKLFVTHVTPYSHSRRPGFVPKLVNALACRRISELGDTGYSWLDPHLVITSFFYSLTCEQRIVMYFCLFTYMYQDSLKIPVVYFINVAVGLMSELYIINRNYNRASILQARLSTYLGLLENNTTPNYAASSTHLPDHLFQNILFLGPLFEYTDFLLERSLKDTKKDKQATTKSIHSLCKKSNVKSLASTFIYSAKAHTVHLSNSRESQISLSTSLDYDKWVLYSLIDDYVFSMNTYMPHDSYLDHVFAKTEQQWDRRYGYLKDKIPKPCGEPSLYSSLSWNHHHYEAVPEMITDTPSVQWLQQNMQYVAFTRGFDNCLYYFVVCGFLVYKVDMISYPLAICSPIKVESMSREYYSYYCLKLADDWNSCLTDYVVLSLYRLTMGTSIMLPFANRTVWGIAPMILTLVPFHEVACDKLFIGIKQHIMKNLSFVSLH